MSAKKMTKNQIAKVKLMAKNRKNRRLSTGEFQRVMALATTVEKADNYLPVVNPPLIKGRKIKQIDPECYNKKLSKRIETKLFKESKLFKRPDTLNDRKRNKNRRLTKEQYESLMKKAAIELGINNHKTIPMVDNNKPMTNEDILWLCIDSMWYENPKLLDQYKKLIRNKKLDFKDKLWALAYVYSEGYAKTDPRPKEYQVDPKQPMLSTRNHFVPMIPVNKPMFYIPEKERINVVRKVVKTKGDVKIHPLRMLPNEEYFKEIKDQKRTRLDSFDRMSLNKKIMWARYFVFSTKIDIANTKPYNLNTEEVKHIMFMMKYCCRMVKIPEFQGGFKNPFWILWRASEYNIMTEQESKIFIEMALKQLDGHRKTIPIIETKMAINALMPTIKNLKLYGKINKQKADQINLKTINDLILGAR
jgi:hypothetical protein